MKSKRRVPMSAAALRQSREAALVAMQLGGDDDELLTEVALKRIENWLNSPAGTPYDNTDIRELAGRRKAA